MGSEVVDYQEQIAAVREAFEREFGRFARFRDPAGAQGLALGEAEALLRELADVRTRHTAKKSALAGLMKLIGRVPADERAAFGQTVQSLNGQIAERLDGAQAGLKNRIAALPVERGRVDVTRLE